MSTLDRRRANLQGKSSFPKFPYKRIEIKKLKDDGRVVFSYYDSKAKEDKHFAGPIEGILIGNAYYQEAFNRAAKSWVKSAPYFVKSNITGFQSGKKVFGGSQDELEVYLKDAGYERAKKFSVIFVMTEDGSVLGIHTNLTIAIDQLQRGGNDVISNKIVLAPVEYDPSDQTITESGHDWLGDFAKTNKPKYASISEGAKITPEDEAKVDLNSVLDDFEEWKNYLVNGGSPEDDQEQVVEEDVPVVQDDVTDDLPF